VGHLLPAIHWVCGAGPKRHIQLDQRLLQRWVRTIIEEQKYREDATGNAVVARAQRWRPQVNGRKNVNKSKLLS
jgi:hypothetical protein